MTGTPHADRKAWTAVMLMILGFTLCTVAFIDHNLLWLWITGGVLGAVGIVLAKASRIMQQYH